MAHGRTSISWSRGAHYRPGMRLERRLLEVPLTVCLTGSTLPSLYIGGFREGGHMRSRYLRLGWRTYLLVFAGVLLCASLVMIAGLTAGQQPAAPAIDADDIGGVVTGAPGPEAGVWVIAETRNLPTRLIKSVVTDDRGRF